MKPFEKVFLVINPVSGVKDNENCRQTIEAFGNQNNWSLEVHETEPDEDLKAVVRKMVKRGVDCVLAGGGDGTVAAVVSGLEGSGVPLGILPLGTGNLLARDLKIPLALQGALDLLISDEQSVQRMDLIQVNDDVFVMNVSIGVSADTMRSTGREEKQKFGMLAYFRRAVEAIYKGDRHRFHVEVDGRILTFKASEVMITNQKLMGLQPRLEGVDVDAEDGRLDMFIVRANTLREYLGVLGRFFIPTKPQDETQLKHISIREMATIRTASPLNVQADGEVIGKTPVEIRVMPNALSVIVPKTR